MGPLVTPGRNISSKLALILDIGINCQCHQDGRANAASEAALGLHCT
jgi:hypothetical protein